MHVIAFVHVIGAVALVAGVAMAVIASAAAERRARSAVPVRIQRQRR